jgi:choline dehydrogenase
VGDPKILSNYSIPLVFKNEFVGENLQDHFMTRICYETSSQDTVNYMMGNKFSFAKQLLNYLVFKKGFFSTTTLKSTAYLRSNKFEPIPNLRIQVSLMSAEGRIPESGKSGLDLSGIRASLDPGSAFHIGVYGIYPDSRGYSHINSLDINSPTNIQPNYLDTERDQKTVIEGLHLIRKLAESPALKNIITNEIRPTKQVISNEDLLNFAKETGHTCWHPIGTCKMGLEKNSVVDIDCKVYGTTKLRVVDGSVLPMHISSNTNIPILMLAEKISASIAQANKQ